MIQARLAHERALNSLRKPYSPYSPFAGHAPPRIEASPHSASGKYYLVLGWLSALVLAKVGRAPHGVVVALTSDVPNAGQLLIARPVYIPV